MRACKICKGKGTQDKKGKEVMHWEGCRVWKRYAEKHQIKSTPQKVEAKVEASQDLSKMSLKDLKALAQQVQEEISKRETKPPKTRKSKTSKGKASSSSRKATAGQPVVIGEYHDPKLGVSVTRLQPGIARGARMEGIVTEPSGQKMNSHNPSYRKHQSESGPARIKH